MKPAPFITVAALVLVVLVALVLWPRPARAAGLDDRWTLADLASLELTVPAGLPPDVFLLADPRDPLAQSRLWGAIYTELPRGFLVEVCLVESGCKAIGVHAGDAHLGASAWRGVWARGKVDRSCPHYPDPADVDDAWWPNASTRGAHGLIAAYHVRLLGRCVPLDALDLPFVSAWAAAEKAQRACAGLRERGLSCTRERLRCDWARAKQGSKACRLVVRRFRATLARFREWRPDIDPRERFTIDGFRKARARGHTDDDRIAEDHPPGPAAERGRAGRAPPQDAVGADPDL